MIEHLTKQNRNTNRKSADCSAVKYRAAAPAVALQQAPSAEDEEPLVGRRFKRSHVRWTKYGKCRHGGGGTPLTAATPF